MEIMMNDLRLNLSPAETLAVIRKRKQLSIKQMAKKLGISRQLMSQIEKGLIPDKKLMNRISKVTGMPINLWDNYNLTNEGE